MFSLHHCLYALGAFYGVIGLVILRRAGKPTCRICVHFEHCPTRRWFLHDPDTKRCYEE